MTTIKNKSFCQVGCENDFGMKFILHIVINQLCFFSRFAALKRRYTEHCYKLIFFVISTEPKCSVTGRKIYSKARNDKSAICDGAKYISLCSLLRFRAKQYKFVTLLIHYSFFSFQFSLP
jgi:hypothetical protein